MTRADRWIALALFAAAVLYLWSLPRSLGWADEAYFLYEAKRIREGEVLYRDVFQFITPLSSYTMAFLFWLFGTSITTAHGSTAVVHGLTMVFIYASARAVDARRSLATTAAVAFLAVSQPAWPYASWHWFSTNFMAALLWSLLALPWRARPRWALVPGLLNGALIASQQQRGTITAAAVGVLLVVDHLCDRRYADGESFPMLARRVTFFAAGVLLVTVPILTIMIAGAGIDPVVQALVRFPLESYRRTFHTTWGSLGPFGARYAAYTFPGLLAYLPLVLLIPALRIARGVITGTAREEVRQLTILVVFGIGAIGSVFYYPDFIHAAFIAGVFFVAAAEAVEWLLTVAVRPHWASAPAGWALALVVLIGLSAHLAQNRARLRSEFPVARDTAFGRLDFASQWEPALLDATRALVDRAPSPEIFCYPNLAAPYLAIGAKNPTPYQYFDASVFPTHDTQRVIETLESRRVPYVLAGVFFLRPTDPIAKLLAEHYTPLELPEVDRTGEVPAYVLYARKDLAETSAAVRN